MDPIPLSDGRRAFGEDPSGYDKARPPYPERLYEILRERCGVGAATDAFEIGPGPGAFSERFLAIGIRSLVAVEPDVRLANFLRERMKGNYSEALRVETTPFEEVELARESFDLGVAATSFHWVEAGPGLAKVYSLLRPGGAWAMWWNVYMDLSANDPFFEASHDLFQGLGRTPSYRNSQRQGYGLDTEARLKDLSQAGFVDIVSEEVRWRKRMTTDEVVGLAATFSPVILLPPEENVLFLGRLRALVDQRFGGVVERSFVTPIYTAKKAG